MALNSHSARRIILKLDRREPLASFRDDGRER